MKKQCELKLNTCKIGVHLFILLKNGSFLTIVGLYTHSDVITIKISTDLYEKI